MAKATGKTGSENIGKGDYTTIKNKTKAMIRKPMYVYQAQAGSPF